MSKKKAKYRKLIPCMWLKVDDYTWACSHCGFWFKDKRSPKNMEINYCPKCGRKPTGELISYEEEEQVANLLVRKRRGIDPQRPRFL